jgi:hypothetical protein
MKGILPKYFKSQWSFAKVKLQDQGKLCAFAEENMFTGMHLFLFVFYHNKMLFSYFQRRQFLFN